MILRHHWNTRPVFLVESGFEVTGHRYLYDATLGWRNIPNWKATTFGKALTINSLGMRDREYETVKPPGVRRILVLGDSYTWGYGVADDEIYTEILEAALNAPNDDPHEGVSWEVLNTGVSGWGTDQQYLYLKEEGLRFEPDIVVVAFFVYNDPTDNTMSVRYGLSKPIFLDENLTPANVPVPRPGARREVLLPGSGPVELTLALLSEIGELCAITDIPCVVMKFGLHWTKEDPAIVEWNRRFVEQIPSHSNIHFLDLDADYERRDVTVEQLVSGNDDYHWNAFGHDLTAEQLYDFLKEQGLIELIRDEEHRFPQKERR